MSVSTNFSRFLAQNPMWETKYKVYQRDDSVYKRIICVWKEENIEHQYHACINTTTGEMFLDCRRRKIMAKHITLALLRPIHTVVKTLWHLTIIGPLSIELYQLAQGKQTLKQLGNHTVKSLADIVRTPAYGLAMTILHLHAVFLGCIRPNTLYATRDVIGKLERKMLRVTNIRNANYWALSPCFSPLSNIYNSKKKATNVKSNFAKMEIEFRREHRALFNDCLTLFPKNKVYKSAAAIN